jgi:hypothetical protein
MFAIQCVVVGQQEEYEKLIDELLAKGADPNWQGSYIYIETNPLPRFCGLQQFVNHQRKTNDINTRYTALHWLILESTEGGETRTSELTLRIAKKLLNHGADIGCVDFKGRTPLMCFTPAWKAWRERFGTAMGEETEIQLTKLGEYDRGIDNQLTQLLSPYKPRPLTHQQGSKSISDGIFSALSVALPEFGDDYLDDMSETLIGAMAGLGPE